MLYKHYFKKYVIGIFLFVGAVISFNYFVDPLQFYRQPNLYEARYITNARFQMPGVLKHFEYDTVIVGTSMSQNFSEAYVDDKLGVKSLNAAISGASSREQSLVARLAIGTGKVKHMFWEINFDSFFGEVERVRDEYGDFPFHMYDHNPFNDVKYLFSYYPLKEAFYIFTDNYKGSEVNRDFSKVYKFGNDRPALNEEEVVKKLQKTGARPGPMAEGHQYENMLAHFEENILPVLKAHPEVNFTLYYPPFSIIYWFEVKERNAEIFQARMKLKEEIFRQVEQLSNVQVYDFQAEEQITYVYSNYMDTSHLFMNINDALIDLIKMRQPVASLMEAQDLISKLEGQVHTVNAALLID